MANLWAAFRALLPSSPLLVGTVQMHNEDGTSTLLLPDGGVMRARGTSVAVGLKAFVRAGIVEGPAPNLPAFIQEV